MSTKSRYAEQLRDPRWQKRRLKVLEAAGWTCEECGAKSRELHVHHGYYGKGMAPWDYPADTLHVLCNDCHAVAEALLVEIRQAIGAFRFSELQRVIEALHSIKKKAIETTELGQPVDYRGDIPEPPAQGMSFEEEVQYLEQLVRKERIRQGIDPPAVEANCES